MANDYSLGVCRQLLQLANDQQLHRPDRIVRYEAGDTLQYNLVPVITDDPSRTIPAEFAIDKFVGGGFAGQVYRVRAVALQGNIPGLSVDTHYALKILIPPSKGSLFFRNLLYGIGFQASFQLQCNPTAARAGALWQKLIRRGAGIKFGDESCVNDVHATFVDSTLGSCGEISNWIDGRTWRLEVDQYMDLLGRWKRGCRVDTSRLGSPEFRAKKQFMHNFVDLLHEMGAHEFARQYEWSTCKSQPNCLKRFECDDDPSAGLTAVDFRAGLALLPFLPMSPGDVVLILKGLVRGSLVQFDRGNLKKLESYLTRHEEKFADLKPQLEQLKQAEDVYRNSIPDITHNHIRLLGSAKLWSTMTQSAVTGWKVRNHIDAKHETAFRTSSISTILFYWIGIIPLLGPVLRKAWGHAAWRTHYAKLIASPAYFGRAVKAIMAEKVLSWHRAGRVSEAKAKRLAQSLPRFALHVPISILPPGLHKFITDGDCFKERLHFIIVRPVKLYFNASLREQWLRDMVEEGRKKNIITTEDAEEILGQLREPYIQKYLKSLAVHVCTVPITQVVSITVAFVYILMHPGMSKQEASLAAAAIIGLFQVVPISPGSLTRGLYVLYLVIRERNFKDYNIAVFLGFFKYVGYLAFPIQMTYRYPTLARFMAGHWATDAVHVVPVFGESGALLEHWVYGIFYNWPLTIRRKINARMTFRHNFPVRYWHAALYLIAAASLFFGAGLLLVENRGSLPGLKEIWYLMLGVPLLLGAGITTGAGSLSLGKRIILAALTGLVTGLAMGSITLYFDPTLMQNTGSIIGMFVWRAFVLTIFATVGAILTELMLPDPTLKLTVQA
ncbi:MAG: hypothetical protein GF398_01280 [Chitinivibrionales bacterium]|nr:hypothetical protein [Chitinivibrionales bacterium]